MSGQDQESIRVITYEEMTSFFGGLMHYLRRKWWIIGLSLLAGGLISVMLSLSKPSEFTATMRFMVNEEQAGGGGRMSSVLSSFGLGGLGGGGEKANPTKILSIAQSSLVVLPTLLERTKDDTTQNLLSEIVEELSLSKVWFEKGFVEDTATLKRVLAKADSATVANEYDWVLQDVYKRVVGGPTTPGMISTESDKITGIMTMSIKSTDPDLSTRLLAKNFDKLTRYYVSKTVEPQRTTYEHIAAKTDSIRQRLSTIANSIAGISDTQQAIPNSRSKVRREELVRELQILTLAYSKAVENKEMAEFSLQSQTPFLQVIDMPLPPLRPEPKGLVKSAILAAIGASLLTTLVLVSFYILKKK